MGRLGAALRAFKKPEVPDKAIGTPRGGEIGVTGTSIYGTIDFARYNPDDLMITKGNTVYRNMMRDDQVKPVLQFKVNAVLSRGWFFDVQTDDAGEPLKDQEEMAEFFKYAVDHIRGSFSDKLIEILSAFQNGFSVVEKVFAPIQYEGKTYWGVKELKLRPFYTFNGGFKADKHGNLEELNQIVGGGREKIPLSKIIHFVHQPDVDRHYGESDLRACHRAWWGKDIGIKFFNIFLERHASGFIWAQVKGGLDPGEKSNLEDLLRNISAAMTAHVPEKIDLNVIQPLRTDAFERAIAMYDRAIAKSILVPNLLGLTEQGRTGSYSQSQTQIEAFFWVLDIIANRLEEALNEQLFRQLAVWNFGTEDFPWFRFEPISEEQKARILDQWGLLVEKGAVTKTDADEAHVRNLMGFPEKPEPEEKGEKPPGPELPVEQPTEEEIQNWISAQPEERREFVRREFAAKPWLKRVNFAVTKGALDEQDGRFLEELNAAMGEAKLSFEKQVANIAGERSLGNVRLKEFNGVGLPKGLMANLRRTIRKNLNAMLETGYELARRELPKRVQAKAIRPGMDKDQVERFLSQKAMTIAGVMEQDTLKGVQRQLENAIKYDKTLNQTMKALAEDTTLLQMLPEVDAGGRPINVPARLENIVRTNTSDALNQARQALFGQPEFRGFVLAYEYSAIMDDRVTDICEHLNGRVRKEWGNYTPPNHFMCRSILVPVTVVDEWDGKESAKPTMEPQKGFA